MYMSFSINTHQLCDILQEIWCLTVDRSDLAKGIFKTTKNKCILLQKQTWEGIYFKLTAVMQGMFYKKIK